MIDQFQAKVHTEQEILELKSRYSIEGWELSKSDKYKLEEELDSGLNVFQTDNEFDKYYTLNNYNYARGFSKKCILPLMEDVLNNPEPPADSDTWKYMDRDKLVEFGNQKLLKLYDTLTKEGILIVLRHIHDIGFKSWSPHRLVYTYNTKLGLVTFTNCSFHRFKDLPYSYPDQKTYSKSPERKMFTLEWITKFQIGPKSLIKFLNK